MSIAKPEMIDWVRKNVLPLKTVNAGAGFEDLHPLRQWIGDARIVGLGEANHVTSEFFKLKHRLFEFLVSELGFNLFLLETQLPESLPVNRYVLTGEGDARHSLASASNPSFVWNCEELYASIEWMRRWNATHERKVYFYGCDAFTTKPPAIFLLKYLRQRDLATYQRVRESLLPLAYDAEATNWPSRSDAERRRAREAIRDVNEALERLTADTPEAQYELGMARLHGTVLDQSAEIWAYEAKNPEDSARHTLTVRDRSMARNLAALLELHGPDAKAVISADNSHLHLREGAWFPSPASAGKHLREMFGADFFMLGFRHDHGAVPHASDPDGPAATIPSTPGTLDSFFAEVGPPVFALDLRDVPKEVADWFADAPPLRQLGEPKSTGAVTVYTMTQWPANIRDYYDALLFVRETSPSHFWPNARDTYFSEASRQDRPTAEGLVNLDFGAGVRHWRTLPQPSAVGTYQTAVVSDRGAVELEVARPESSWPWDVYVLTQVASAEPWRGKRVVVRCRASIDAVHDGGSAQLALRVLPKHVSGALELWAWQRAVTWDAQTQELSVTAQIRDDAETIALALIVTGDGRARFGPITITGLV